MDNVQKLVQRRDWQALRKSLVGTWKEHAAENVGKLRRWLGAVSTADDDKLKIVHNYLTGSGFRIGVISHPTITKLRDQVRAERQKRKEHDKED